MFRNRSYLKKFIYFLKLSEFTLNALSQIQYHDAMNYEKYLQVTFRKLSPFGFLICKSVPEFSDI
jgi:hypothetical protein